MNEYLGRAGSIPTTQEEVARDPGLRKFMLGVYTKMALGLIWSAVLAYAVGAYLPLTQVVLTPPVIYLVQWGPVVLLLGSNFFMRNPSPTGTGLLYWAVVTLIGLGLGVWVYLALTGTGVTTRGGTQLLVTFGTMAKAFLVTAIAFGGLSLWGYTTKRNLSGLHSMLVMGTWGLLALVGIGYFFQSSMYELGVQVIALGIYAVLMATQTNMLRESYFVMQGDTRSLGAMTNYGALNLYISFIQVFQLLLSLMSRR